MININIYKVYMVKEKGGRYNFDDREIDSPKKAAKIFNEVLNLDKCTEEVLCLMTLSTKNKITGIFEVHRGSIDTSIVHPREIFKRALISNAAHIIIAHNHPSGDPTPSKQDINITSRISEAGKILGINLLDHVIIGENDRIISLKEKSII